jgi:hypothetical protein
MMCTQQHTAAHNSTHAPSAEVCWYSQAVRTSARSVSSTAWCVAIAPNTYAHEQ